MPSQNVLNKVERLFRKSHTSRTATAIGIRGSATAAETSGTGETRQQWAPASRNAVELIEGWDEVLSAIDPNCDESPDQTIVESLGEIQTKLPQCKLPPANQYLPFEPDDYTRSLLFLSAYASKSAYGTTPAAELPFLQRHSLDIISTQSFKPSFDGSIKQLELRVLSSSVANEKTVFVAVRGTAPMVDWLINFNGEDVDTMFLSRESEQDDNLRKAHRGFLGVAEKMEPAVTQAIETMRGECENIVFTGHSAGGGVAALLFMHYLACGTFGDTKLSCLTFAAPPVLSVTHNPHPLPPSSTFLSVINENDPVPRADKSYIMSFSNLYATYKADPAALAMWTLPAPKLHVPQESTIVMLRPKQEGEEMRVSVHELGREQFEGTVALDAEAHRMDWYLEELRVWAEE